MPSLPLAIAEQRFAQAWIGRLATVRPDGGPHAVPVCFALHERRIYTAVDAKPKATRALQRLANVAATGRASLLVDHYEEDWSRLWWVRLDGTGRVEDDGDTRERALGLLAAKDEQYRQQIPVGPAVVIEVTTWRAWP
jgi:PPOX class probable F420-dependent enzyme